MIFYQNKARCAPCGLLVFLALWLVTIIYFPVLAAIIFPGTIFNLIILRNKLFDIFAPGMSAAFWIIVFAFLKFIPLNYVQIFYALQSLFAGLFLFAALKYKNVDFRLFNPGRETVFTVIFLMYLMPIFIQNTPAGADMATHTYTAKVILNNGGAFPKSFEPLVPINHFGFAPYGMPALTSLLSLLENIPVAKSMLIVIALSYAFFAAAVYQFLIKFIKPWPAALTVFMLLFFGYDINRYLVWGGVPTILSISFMIFGINHFHLDSKNIIIKTILISIFFAASFYTHPTPLSGLIHFTFVYFIYLVFKRKPLQIKRVLFIVLITVLFLIPFLTSIVPVSQTTTEAVGAAFKADYMGLSDKRGEVVFSTIDFIKNRTGERLFVLFIFGVLISLKEKRKEAMWATVAFFVLFLLIINSQIKILPWTIVLFPDRILTAEGVVIGFFVGIFLEKLFDYISTIWKSGQIYQMLLLPFVVLLLLYAVNIMRFEYLRGIINEPRDNVSVTDDDLTVFKWISENTKPTDIIDNNYGDAGIWIPTIVNRTIKWNDSYAQYLAQINDGQNKFSPSYIFVGSNVVYNGLVKYSNKDMINNLLYIPVFASGNAGVYKIKK